MGLGCSKIISQRSGLSIQLDTNKTEKCFETKMVQVLDKTASYLRLYIFDLTCIMFLVGRLDLLLLECENHKNMALFFSSESRCPYFFHICPWKILNFYFEISKTSFLLHVTRDLDFHRLKLTVSYIAAYLWGFSK